ncbi:uncharacterized protein BT62DRAFT_995487, partial [Guyanagaster necrorhizus]
MNVLAAETLTEIFEHLDKYSDLLHVMQTCKIFYDIGIRQFYRHIRYNDRRQFRAHDASCFNQRDDMHCIPRSLELAGAIYPDPTADHDLNDNEGDCVHFQIDMWIRILSFTSLHTLCFRDSDLPDARSFGYLLQGCQSLRKLVIDECTFHEVPVDLSEGYDVFPCLPITDLSLFGCSTLPGSSDPYSFLRLLTITALRTLSVSVSDRVNSFLARRDKHNLPLPCKLETLRLHFTLLVRTGRQDEIATFLTEECQSVHALEVFNFFWPVPENLRLLPRALGNLTSYRGPPNFLFPLMDGGSLLKYLEISYPPINILSALSLLEKVGTRWPYLESLSITIKEWDREILYAISHIFRDFREVKIKYCSGYPNELSMLNMPSMFFSKMKNLRTLHIYNSMDPPVSAWFSNGDDDVCDLMTGWLKTCPNLTEVRWEKDKLFCRKSTKREHRWCSRMDLQPVVPNLKRRRQHH